MKLTILLLVATLSVSCGKPSVLLGFCFSVRPLNQPMIKACTKMLAQLGVSDEQIAFDEF